MILKSYIVENDLSILQKFKTVLFYGENEGAKDDFKKKIIKGNNDSEIINIFHDEVFKNKELLNNLTTNASLFSQKKVIFIHEASDKIFDLILDSIENIKEDTKIFIFSNILEKKSKLRNFCEKSDKVGIIACYQDTEITLRKYINTNLKMCKGLTPEITNIIIQNSNLNRKIIKDEIVKIQNYFVKKTINKNDLEELLNINTNSHFSELADAALKGNKSELNKLMGEIDFLQEETFFYLNLITNKVFKLKEIKQENLDKRGEDLLLEKMKNKIFWKDRPNFIAQLKKWDKYKLENLLKNITKTELILKRNSFIKKDTLVKNLLIEICDVASNAA